MGSNIDISVVIVNYNVKDFLIQCLRSVLNSSKDLEVEIIVVDNNSTDGSVEFARKVFPMAEFVNLDENIGFARANNIGIEKARGKYTLILNPDTILDENTLGIMFDYMERTPEVGCSGCKVLNPDGSFQLACRRGFPTPWASFCKLFGLQKLFPKSKLFASYNQTFKSTDETYYIDAVVGAFMFCRTDALRQVNGFDPDFFMYGEDIDLCFRLSQAGWKNSYTHLTSIIHYKGESTKRSSLNEIKLFYDAMKIFSRKHYSGSSLFLVFLSLGINLRSLIAQINKRKRDMSIVLLDLITLNAALMFSTWYRFDGFLSFPDYAYPAVFIVITTVVFLTQFFIGEYFENRQSSRRALFGLLISFFILSSLTYYFKDYAFSRGVLLMTIALSALSFIFIRGIFSLIDKTKGSQADRRIIIAGTNQQAENIINSFRNSDARNMDIVGVVTIGDDDKNEFLGYKILGNTRDLSDISTNYKVHEVIITDKSISQNDLIKYIADKSLSSVRFHIAQEYEELLSARIINDITGIQPTIPIYNLNKLRYKVLKRSFDILISLFLLTIGLPALYLLIEEKSKMIKLLFKALLGKMSIVGVYPDASDKKPGDKAGITGLAHISKPDNLSKEAIQNLNNFYRQHYSLTLDLDIILKFIIRKKSSGKFYT